MPFYGKPTLQRLYHTWNGTKRKHIDRYIEVAYGKTFLLELKMHQQNVCKKGQGKSSLPGHASRQSLKKTENTLRAQQKNSSQTRHTDEDEGHPQETSSKATVRDKTRRPRSLRGEDTVGDPAATLSQSQEDNSMLVTTCRRSCQRRQVIARDASSTMGPNMDSSLTPQCVDKQEGARMVSKDSTVDDVNSLLSKKDQDMSNTICNTRRSSRAITRMNDERRDDNTKEDSNLKVSSSQTSQGAASGGKGRAVLSETPKSRRSGEGQSSIGSEVKQLKRQAGGSHKLLQGKITTDHGDSTTRKSGKQGQANKWWKVVKDNKCDATSVNIDDSSLKNQDFGVTVSQMMHQSSYGENMDETNAAGVRKIKGKGRISVKGTNSKTSSPPAEQIVPAQQQQHQTPAGTTKCLKGRHLEEGKRCSLEAGCEQSIAMNLRNVIEAGVMNETMGLELQNSEVGSELHKIQPLNVDIESSTETSSDSLHQSEDSQDEEMDLPPSQRVLSGQTDSGERDHMRKRVSGPRTRINRRKYEFQRDVSGFRCLVSGADSEINEIFLQRPSGSSKTETQKASTEHGLVKVDEGGLSCSQERAHRPLRLRQTARKCCPQRRKGTKGDDDDDDDNKMYQVTSSITDQMTSLGSPSRCVSVKLHRLPKAAACSVGMKCGLKRHGQMETGEAKILPMQEDFRSLQSVEGDSEDEDKVVCVIEQVCDRPRPETPKHEEMIMKSDGKTSVQKNEKQAGSSHSKRPEVSNSEKQASEICTKNSLLVIQRADDTFGQERESDLNSAGLHSSGCHESPSPIELQKDYPSFGNQQKDVDFPMRSKSTCEEVSSSAVKPRIKKMPNSSLDENLWNMAVVACIEDVPLLEGDDDGSTLLQKNETEMPMSRHEEVHQEDNSQDSSSHDASQESQTGLSSVKDVACSEDANDINVAYDDSIINESVEDDDVIPPTDYPLPGLSHLEHNPTIDNLSPQRSLPASPVFDVIPKMKSKQTLMKTKKISSTRGKSVENQENEFVSPGNLTEDDPTISHWTTPQESDQIKNIISRPRLRCRDGRGSIATVTPKDQDVEGQNRFQTTSSTATMGNTGVGPQLLDNCSSGKIDASLDDFNSMAKIPTAYRKIRTPAEKKQGWSTPHLECRINYPHGPSSKEGRTFQDTTPEEIGPEMILPDQQLSLTNAQREMDPANRSGCRNSRTRKRKRSQEGRVRGQSGWEESLRQKPATITKFQAGNSPTSSKKQESSQEKTRWQLQSPMKITPSVMSKSEDVKHRRPEKPTPFREVWQPPPMKKLRLNEGSHSALKLIEDGEPDQLATSQVSAPHPPTILQDKFRYGELIWGKMKGFNWWPGTVIHHHMCRRDAAPSDACWVKWFGDEKFSKLNLNQVISFAKFSAYFSQSTFLHTALYRRAVFQALQVASTRSGKAFSSDPTEYKSDIPKRSRHSDLAWLKFYELCNEMISWAKEGFKPNGHDAIMPSNEEQQLPPRPPSPSPHLSPILSTPTKRTGCSPSKGSGMWKDRRDTVIAEILNGTKCIEEICIGCGSSAVAGEHPFFVGGLCEVCRVEFVEVAYVFDEDGYQSFCCICAEGKDIILCDRPECYRSFCHDCLDYLVGPGTVQAVLATDQWRCYMCSPEPTAGLLSRRDDWPQKLLLFFQQDCNQCSPPMWTPPPVEMDQRKPIRVLSLFDGIGTGMLVLKELGLKVECYYASEISKEAKQVSSVRHDGIIQQLDDVRYITEQEIQSVGPFDLLIGGSPCNDLSIANPARKGLFEGTGRLFFDFYRILTAARPQGNRDHPFFWLFENVVGMQHKDKMDISRFLQCDPVIVDAKDVSPAHRARYFWGNLPGMNRPNVATDNNTLCLQDCLEPNCNRQAQFSKVRTLTSKLNSVKQTNEQVLPVLMNGQEDTLWCTEMERIFGFPEHYTDIANMSRTSRHKLIGQAWSVPVIKHLLAPLKEYFACETHQ